MKIRLNHLYMLSVIFAFAECLDYRIFSMLNNSLYYITAFIILICFFQVRKININGIFILCCAVLYFILDNIYLTKTFILGSKYAIIFIAIYLFERVSFKKYQWKIGVFFGGLFFVRYFFSAQSYLDEFNTQKSILGLKDAQIININIPCFMMFVALLFLILLCKAYDIRKEKLITFLGMILSVLLSYRLDCRITILTSIMAYLLMEWFPVTFFTKKRTLVITSMLFLVGYLFPYVYVALFYNGSLRADDMLFSGRETIWFNFFNILLSNPKAFLFGLGANFRSIVSGGLSMHNSLLEMTFNFGTVGTLIYYIYAIKTIRSAFNRGITNTRLYLIEAYLIMLIFSFANTAIQREYLFVFYSLFLGLSNNFVKESYINEINSQ